MDMRLPFVRQYITRGGAMQIKNTRNGRAKGGIWRGRIFQHHERWRIWSAPSGGNAPSSAGRSPFFVAYKLYCRYIGTFFRISIYKIPATCELAVNQR